MLSNREIASVVLLCAIVVTFIAVPRLRRAVGPSMKGFIKAVLAPRLVVIFLAFLLWASGLIVLAQRVGLWDFDLLKDSIVIVVALGFPMLVRSVSMKSGPSIVRTVVLETAGLSALIAFYVNLVSFPLWVELLVQPLLTLVIALQAVSGTKEEWRAAHRLLSGILMVVGISAIIWTTVQITAQLSEPQLLGFLRSLVLSVALPIGLVPFFYLTAFNAFAESALARIGFVNSQMPRRVALAIWLGLHLRVSLAAQLTGRHNRVGEAVGFRDGLARMEVFRESLRSPMS